MEFNSFAYIGFLALVACVYYLLPLLGRKILLVAASFVFYMAWNAKYSLLMLAVILITYAAAVGLVQLPRYRRLFFYTALTLVLGLLFYFKYFNFFIDTLNHVFALHLDFLNVLLPVGISFYVFQAVGYLVDVYRDDNACERSLLTYTLFISFFPQLVAGPIERSENMMRQFHTKQVFRLENLKNGITLILVGLVEKVVIADRLAVFVNGVFDGYQTAGRLTLLTAAVFFAFQVYCDFNAYSLIAIGSARIMGYRLMNNFRSPYLSRSFADYWSRWHISLSSWFQDYIFTPFVWTNPLRKLSSRFSAPPMRTGLLLVFLASGFWHGANWTFVTWGLLHAAFRIFEASTARPKKRFLKKHGISLNNPLLKTGEILLTFSLNCLTYIFFRAVSVGQAGDYIRCIFAGNASPAAMDSFGLNRGGLLFSCGAIAVLMLLQILEERKKQERMPDVRIDALSVPMQSLIYAGLFLLLAVFGMYGTNYVENPFIYFQF